MKYRVILTTPGTVPGLPQSSMILTESPMFEFSRVLDKIMRHYDDVVISKYIDKDDITVIILHCENDTCAFIAVYE